MFWVKNIRLLSKRLDSQFSMSKEMNEKLNAVIECMRSDRKDINAIINAIKKLQTKGKKK